MQPIWLANLLMRDHHPQEAVDVLREAADRFSNDSRVWNGLFTLYLQNGQIEEAQRTLKALVNAPKLPEGIRHFVAAQGYEALGNVAEAKTQYELAVTSQPDETAFRLRFAKFLLANDTAAARAQYEHVLGREPNNAEARRELANLLAVSGKTPIGCAQSSCSSSKATIRLPAQQPMIACEPRSWHGKVAPARSESPTAKPHDRFSSS